MSSALPSWSDVGTKAVILDFVARVTRERGPDYVPPADRIATFDNDGTLWCEQPMQAQIYFALDRLKALDAIDPGIGLRQPYQAFLKHDLATIRNLGKQAAFEMAFTTHAGVTEHEFYCIARDWLSYARNPKLGRLFVDCVYQPQIELLNYLRENGFRTFIVSGGGIDLIRAFAEEAYGIPREQVIGSSVKTRMDAGKKTVDLVKLPELNSFDDKEAKVRNIGLHIGRRPILAFGNSDGDLPMLRYAKAGSGPRLALLLHHDDAGREFAYDRQFKLSPLAEALDKASEHEITVVSMKRDWARVFDAAE